MDSGDPRQAKCRSPTRLCIALLMSRNRMELSMPSHLKALPRAVQAPAHPVQQCPRPEARFTLSRHRPIPNLPHRMSRTLGQVLSQARNR